MEWLRVVTLFVPTRDLADIGRPFSLVYTTVHAFQLRFGCYLIMAPKQLCGDKSSAYKPLRTALHKNQNKTHRFARHQTETRAIVSLAIPAIISQMAQAGMGVIDAIMAGHHSATSLAAIAVGTNLFNPVIVFIIGILLALNPMVAQLNGQQQWQKIPAIFQNGMFLALLLVIPSFFILRSLEPVLHLIGLDSTVIPITQGYLEALSWGMPGLHLFLALRFANEGLFSTKAIMVVAVSALPLNVVLNYWFMYGGLGIEAMGAVGLGWATGLTYLYMFIALALYTAKTRRYHHLNIFGQWYKPDFTVIKETITLGVPIGLSIGLEVGLFAGVGLMIGSYGIHQISGHQIAMSISAFSYMMPLGLSIAISARVGYHMGRENPLEAKSSGYLGIMMALIIMLANAIFLVSFPTLLAKLYSTDPTVIVVASQLLFFSALYQLADGTQVAAIAALRGMKDTKIPLLICIFAYWVIAFPLGYWLAETLDYGVKGYWIAMVFGLFIAAIMLTSRFYILMNKKTQLWLNSAQQRN
ncbi:MAG: MATE family multidrug resistance protein [Phenylobacterium sp.]|jgi:MATE family multidrug resistance protein